MEERDYERLMRKMVRSLVVLRFSDFSQMVSETIKGEGFILGYLYHNSSAQPGDISRMMQASTAYVAKLLRGMEEKGLIFRRKDPEDKRKILIGLTDKGRDEAAKMEGAVQKGMIRFLKSLIVSGDAGRHHRKSQPSGRPHERDLGITGAQNHNFPLIHSISNFS